MFSVGESFSKCRISMVRVPVSPSANMRDVLTRDGLPILLSVLRALPVLSTITTYLLLLVGQLPLCLLHAVVPVAADMSKRLCRMDILFRYQSVLSASPLQANSYSSAHKTEDRLFSTCASSLPAFLLLRVAVHSMILNRRPLVRLFLLWYVISDTVIFMFAVVVGETKAYVFICKSLYICVHPSPPAQTRAAEVHTYFHVLLSYPHVLRTRRDGCWTTELLRMRSSVGLAISKRTACFIVACDYTLCAATSVLVRDCLQSHAAVCMPV